MESKLKPPPLVSPLAHEQCVCLNPKAFVHRLCLFLFTSALSPDPGHVPCRESE